MKTLVLIALVGLLAGCGDPNYNEQVNTPTKTCIFPVISSVHP